MKGEEAEWNTGGIVVLNQNNKAVHAQTYLIETSGSRRATVTHQMGSAVHSDANTRTQLQKPVVIIAMQLPLTE